MSGQQNISNERLEGEGFQPLPEEINDSDLAAQPDELMETANSSVTQDNENVGHQYHSLPLVYFLWILGISCLCTYIYIDVRLIFIDHRLTRNLPPIEERGILYFISRITHIFTYTFLSFSVIWALVNAQKKRSVLYFILFLELMVVIGLAEQLWIMEIFNSYPNFIPTLVALLGVVLIKLLQELPLHLTKQHIVSALTHRRIGRWLIKPLSLLLKMRYCFLIFLPLFLSIAWLVPGINFITRNWIINGIAIIVGFCYIFIQIMCSTRKQLQTLYWWLWTMLVHFLFSIYMIITQLLNLGLLDETGMVLFTITLISIIIFCLMTVYFTDLLDAALVLRKTFIYGSLLLILLAFFGTVEHYVIHYIAHWLHLKNTVLSSIFAGLTGILFHPLKEKLSHWVKHFEKQTMKLPADQ